MIKKILASFLIATSPAFADQYKLTVTGEIDSDSSSKQEELLIKFSQKDDNKRYDNSFKIHFDNGYSKDNGSLAKNKESFDYEQNIKFFHIEDHFITLYGRYKDDDFQSASNNYTILSAGYGISKTHKDETFDAQISLGQKRNSIENVIIYRPEISYGNKFHNFAYKLSSGLVKGSGFQTFTNKASVSYPLSKTLSLSYIFEHETSEDDTSPKETSRLNKLALSFSF